MFGVPVDGPVDVFCDNAGVVKNTSVPESTLTKKHQSINCHANREAVAAGIVRVGKEDSTTNLSDVSSKVLSGPRRRESCRGLVMWRATRRDRGKIKVATVMGGSSGHGLTSSGVPQNGRYSSKSCAAWVLVGCCMC